MIDERAMRLACARLEHPGGQGTGYLVTPSIVVTAWHVVEDLEDDEDLELVFDALAGHPSEKRGGSVIMRSLEVDAAIVKLDDPVEHHEPVQLVAEVTLDTPWWVIGYPEVVGEDIDRPGETATPVRGVVAGVFGNDPEKRPALALHTPAAQGGKLHGLSGSAVAVTDGVIGHLYRVVPDPAAEHQATLGIVYACAADQVIALLRDCDVTLEETVDTTPEVEVETLAGAVPELPGDRFHAWVRCADSDPVMAWTRELCNRLESHGLRVSVDTRHLPQTNKGVKERRELLRRCRSAMLVGSADLVERTGWEAERDDLLMAEQGASVYGVWFGPGDPPELAELQWFRFPEGVTGSGVERLGWALVGAQPPADDTASSQVRSSRVSFEDAAIDRLAQASEEGVEQLMAKYQEIGGLDEGARLLRDSPALTLFTAQELLRHGAPDPALDLLGDETLSGLQAKKLRVRALARANRPQAALRLLEEERGELDFETRNMMRKLRGQVATERVRKGTRARYRILISHTQTDEKYVRALLPFLFPFEQEEFLVYREEGEPENVWAARVEEALPETRVGVVLVSPRYVADDARLRSELDPLIEQSKADDEADRVVIHPVYVTRGSPPYGLERADSPNRPDDPVSEMKEGARDSCFTALFQMIEKSLPPRQPLALFCEGDEDQVRPVLDRLGELGLEVEEASWPPEVKAFDGPELRKFGRRVEGNRSVLLLVGEQGLGPWAQPESREILKRKLKQRRRNRQAVMVTVLSGDKAEVKKKLPDTLDPQSVIPLQPKKLDDTRLSRLYGGLAGKKKALPDVRLPSPLVVPPPPGVPAPDSGTAVDRTAVARDDAVHDHPWNDAIEDLEPDLKKGDLTVFLGQGTVLPGEIPRRWVLTRKLLEALPLELDDLKVLPSFNYASSFYEMKENLNELQEYVRRSIPLVVPSIHRRVARLMTAMPGSGNGTPRERLIVTTNFDTLMERALLEQGVPFTRIVQHGDCRQIVVNQFDQVEILESQEGEDNLLRAMEVKVKTGDDEETVSLDVGAAAEGLKAKREAELKRPLDDKELLKVERQATDALDDKLSQFGHQQIVYEVKQRGANSLKSLEVPGYRHPILYKFLGSQEIDESCVITTRQYLRLSAMVKKDDIIPGTIKRYIQKGPALFFGYGLLDPEFIVTHESLFQLTDAAKRAHLRFAIQAAPENEPEDPYRHMERPIWRRIKRKSPAYGFEVVEGDMEEFLRSLIGFLESR